MASTGFPTASQNAASMAVRSSFGIDARRPFTSTIMRPRAAAGTKGSVASSIFLKAPLFCSLSLDGSGA